MFRVFCFVLVGKGSMGHGVVVLLVERGSTVCVCVCVCVCVHKLCRGDAAHSPLLTWRAHFSAIFIAESHRASHLCQCMLKIPPPSTPLSPSHPQIVSGDCLLVRDAATGDMCTASLVASPSPSPSP